MIDLPEDPAPADAVPGLMDFGTVLTPPLGGPRQRVNRMGNRFRIAVAMPPMRAAKTGRQWVSRLIRGQTEGVRMPFPLLDFDPGVPGAVLVSGSGQAGSSLAIKGATPKYVFREGQFFSIVTGGRHHLYVVASETVASATGTATLPLSVMLRRQHLDNDACHFAKPMIEGFIEGDEREWHLALGNFVGLQFAVAESH